MNYILQKYHRSVSNVAMVCVAAVALGSSTYAWFVTNNSVKAKNMTVTANADVEFLEIANVGENFTGSTIAVEAKTPGTGLKLNPVTPLKVSNMDSTGAEQEDLDFSTTGTKGTNGWADDFTWKWTTAQVGTASAKADSVAWNYANTSENASENASEKYYLLNNFKFRTTVQNVETAKLYASTVELTKDVDSNDMDEAVRVMVVGANGMQIYDVGTKTWTYYNANGVKIDKNAFAGLIDKVTYNQNVASADHTVRVYLYYEGADGSLYTTNLNTMQGVTANITFSVDPTGFGA